MARDFKLSNFTFTSVGGTTAGALNHTSYTPTGDAANTGTVQNLFVAAAGTSTGQIYDAKNIQGFRNSKMDTGGSLANFLAGNEISAIANDPALPGGTSYAEMFMTFNMNLVLSATAADNNMENGGYFTVEGGFDNGFGAVDASSWAPIGNPVPMVIPSANLAAVAVAGNAVTTVNAHNLKPGDVVVFYVVTGFSTAPTAKRLYQVLAVPAPNQFTITLTGGTTAVTLAGTPTAGIAVYRALGGAIGGHRAAAQITPTRRSYYRLRLVYVTAQTAGPAFNLSRVGVTLGRDNASTY